MSRCYKHGAESLRRARHGLDWANMLDPLHHYEGVPVLDLPARQHSMCFKGRQAPRLRVTDRAMVRSLTSVVRCPGGRRIYCLPGRIGTWPKLRAGQTRISVSAACPRGGELATTKLRDQCLQKASDVQRVLESA